MLNEAKVLEMIKAKQVKKQKGASMIEYALVLAGVVAIAGFLFTDDGTGNSTVGGALKTKVEAAVQ